MPWDAAELRVATVQGDGRLGEAAHVSGDRGESAIQPQWSPDGILHFVSDRTDWWNLYRFKDRRVEALADLQAEFATPPWVFGMQQYAFASPSRILCTFTRKGTWSLGSLDVERRRLTPLQVPYTEISSLQCNGHQAVFLAGSPTEPLSVIRMTLESGRCEVLRRSTTLSIDPEYLSQPEPIEFPTTGGQTAHALFYSPRSPIFVAPEGERPHWS